MPERHPLSLSLMWLLFDVVSDPKQVREVSHYNLPSCNKSHDISGIPETSTSHAISTRVCHIHTPFHSHSYHHHHTTSRSTTTLGHYAAQTMTVSFGS